MDMDIVLDEDYSIPGVSSQQDPYLPDGASRYEYPVGNFSEQMTKAFDPYKNITGMNDFSVHYVLPFSNHENGALMAIAGFYALLFLIGTCGNAGILTVVHYVRYLDARARHNTTLTYICILCIVDFLSMLPLPMTIIDQVLGFWMFGTFACKLFRLLEHIGKIFSTFILVAFSLDRYCAVCHPLRTKMRSKKIVYLLLSSMFAMTCLMLSPILLFAHSKELIVHEKWDHSTRTVTRLHLYKCIDDLGDQLFVFFTLYCFLLAYLVPLLLMIYFYYGMLTRLFKQTRAVRQSLGARRKKLDDKIPVMQIAVYTLAICLFHFICWTPYWASVLYSLYQELKGEDSVMPTPQFIYFMYGVHALPYINSASNFVLYGLLNRQLHQSHFSDRRTSKNGYSRSSPPLKTRDSARDTILTTNGSPNDGFLKSTLSTYSLHHESIPLVRTNDFASMTSPKPSLSQIESCEDSVVL
ncbi:unnamed protein product, partial [Mesorhabditis belari]|uniref:G-protein coupled receptors family 1 profile domain-containing protein n=1 Tax=Mesorhabditis belari TaxID=2138241 RepID=A0AAF3EH60_9BILA